MGNWVPSILHRIWVCCFLVWGVHLCYSGPHVFVFLTPISLCTYGREVFSVLSPLSLTTFQDASPFQILLHKHHLPFLILPWAVQWVHQRLVSFAFCRWQPPGGTQDFTSYPRQAAWIQDVPHWLWEGIWCWGSWDRYEGRHRCLAGSFCQDRGPAVVSFCLKREVSLMKGQSYFCGHESW